MSTPKKTPAALTALMIVLLIASMVLMIVSSIGNEVKGLVWLLITYFLTAIAALYYACLGSRKETFIFFRVCCIAYALYMFVSIIIASSLGDTAVVSMNAISLAILAILGTAENLHRLRSILFALVNLLAMLVFLCLQIAKGATLIAPLADVALAAAFILMVNAKYYNKSQRGSN